MTLPFASMHGASRPIIPTTSPKGGRCSTAMASSLRFRCPSVTRSPPPVRARVAAIRFLLTRLVDWLAVPEGALVRPKDPLEYYRKLRFHQSVKSISDYGLEG